MKKSITNNNATWILSIVLFAMLPFKNTQATRFNINELGAYNFTFEAIKVNNGIAGSNLLASVMERTGSNYSVFLPFGVQQVNYLINNGSKVVKDQKIARLNGYDVHHFLDEFAAAEVLFKNAENQYNSGARLYKNKALKQSQWIEITKNYFEAQLRFEHLHHYMSFLSIDENDVISIIAPRDGTLRFSNDSVAKLEGELLFDVIPANDIRLKVTVPVKNIDTLSSFQLTNQNCLIEVNSHDNVINNFNVTVWSKTLDPACNLFLGQNIVVTPIYKQAAFAINKSAIFEFENNNYVAVKNSQQIDLVKIELISSTSEEYIFTSEEDLLGKEVLVTSVSAIQGLLLGLGEE